MNADASRSASLGVARREVLVVVWPDVVAEGASVEILAEVPTEVTVRSASREQAVREARVQPVTKIASTPRFWMVRRFWVAPRSLAPERDAVLVRL